MSSTTEKWNRRLMDLKRDVSVGVVPKTRYAILSVPRSGSTLLARGLEATGALGVPLEYLNQNAIEAWRYLGNHNDVNLDSYLTDIESRRTSSTGWFGTKVHYRHFDHHYGAKAFSKAVSFVEQQDYCILTTRADHVLQATSYFRARMSGLWSSEHEEYLEANLMPPIEFDAQVLSGCLNEIRYGEEMWRKVLSASRQKSLEVSYENLIGDYAGQMDQVFSFLGRNNLEIPTQQLRRVARQAEDDLENQFRRHLVAQESESSKITGG